MEDAANSILVVAHEQLHLLLQEIPHATYSANLSVSSFNVSCKALPGWQKNCTYPITLFTT